MPIRSNTARARRELTTTEHNLLTCQAALAEAQSERARHHELIAKLKDLVTEGIFFARTEYLSDRDIEDERKEWATGASQFLNRNVG